MTDTSRPDRNGCLGVTGRYAMAVAAFLACAATQAGTTAGGAPSAVPQGSPKVEDTQAITAQRARGLYLLHCAGCHRFDGSGAPAFGVPTLVNTLGKYQLTAKGRAYLVQVPGARNAGVTDAELAAMTNWQLQAFSAATVPKDFKPYTTEEVRRLRRHPPADIAGERAAILAELPVPLTDNSN